VAVLLALFAPSALVITLLMSLAGLCHGGIMPARDMLVRAITPPGAFGKVFGFVTSGFNLAGVISPLIYGALMDYGAPRAVFLLVAACSLVAIATLVGTARRPRAQRGAG